MCDCDDADLCCILENADLDEQNNFNNPTICSLNTDKQRFVENFESSLIAVTPSTLRFPYNDPKNHTKRLTIWNRTLTALKIQIKSPDPDLLNVFLDSKGTKGRPKPINQMMLYGLAARRVLIRCTPGHHKIARVPLYLFVHKCRDNSCECLQVPVEIYPSTAWFQLPSRIVIPEVVLGQKVHALIILPQPRVSERFFVTFHPIHTQHAITLFPMNGVIGGDNGIKQLRITYAPMQYTTVSCSINVHFPGLSTTTSHEIKILARCRPGNEADLIRKEMEEIESFRPKPVKRKRKFPKILFKTGYQSVHMLTEMENQKEEKPLLSLFTLAGVMRFLLSKKDLQSLYKGVDNERRRKTAVELLALEFDLDHDEKIKIYNAIKQRLGLAFDDERGSKAQLNFSQRKDWEEFQNTVGMALMGKKEELPKIEGPNWNVSENKPNLEESEHPSIRSSSSARRMTKKLEKDDETKVHKSIMADVKLDFTPKQKFVQIVLIIITRYRAGKRLGKIRVLVEELKRAPSIKKRSSKGSSATKTVVSKRTNNEGSVKAKSKDGSVQMQTELQGSKTTVDRKSIKSGSVTVKSQRKSSGHRSEVLETKNDSTVFET